MEDFDKMCERDSQSWKKWKAFKEEMKRVAEMSPEDRKAYWEKVAVELEAKEAARKKMM